MVAFSLFEAAYYSEIIRAGIQAVPRGQVYASYALGMSYPLAMRLVRTTTHDFYHAGQIMYLRALRALQGRRRLAGINVMAHNLHCWPSLDSVLSDDAHSDLRPA